MDVTLKTQNFEEKNQNKTKQSRQREPLTAHREQIVNADIHVLYLIALAPFLKKEYGKSIFDLMYFIIFCIIYAEQ